MRPGIPITTSGCAEKLARELMAEAVPRRDWLGILALLDPGQNLAQPLVLDILQDLSREGAPRVMRAVRPLDEDPPIRLEEAVDRIGQGAVERHALQRPSE